jgi:autotransporter-associated beta strand protein
MMRHVDGVGAPSARFRVQMLPLAAGAAVTLGSLAGSALGQTWIGPANGNFTANANWQGNVAPTAPASSASPVNLTFYSGNGGAITAINDTTAPTWWANSLTFNTYNVNTFNVAGALATGKYQLVGASAAINQNGLGNITMANGTSSPNWGGLLELNADMTFGGTGSGNVTLGTQSGTAGVVETGGARSITISGGAPLRILRNLVLNGANAFSGGLILDGGTVQIGSGTNPTQLGSGASSTLTVTASGGTINMGTSNTSSSLGTLQLNGDLRVIGSSTTLTLSNGTNSAPTVLQGSGTLYVNTASGGVAISGNSNAFTGAVVLDQSDLSLGAVGVGNNLTLNTQPSAGSPNGGSLANAASYDVRAGGTIQMNSNIANSFQNGNRLSDTAPVRLRTGNLTLNGPAALSTASNSNNYTPSDLTEKIGDLTGAGHNTISVFAVSGTGVKSTLEINSLARLQRGTFCFRGTALGNSSIAERGRVIVDTAGTGTFTDDLAGGGGAVGTQNISILPYAMATTSSSDGGSGFVTYNGGVTGDGFRLLAAGEYDLDPAGLTPGNITNNVKLDTTVTNNVTQTMNSLVLAPGASADGMVSGTGTLTITSGAVLQAGTHGTNTTNQQTISNNLAFGGTEAVISTGGGGGLRITGQLSGSNGLTKAGNGTSIGSNVLVLTADNSGLTGTLTLNSGGVQFNQDLALPGTGQIVVNGSGLSGSGNSATTSLLWGGGTNSTTLSRDVVVNTGTINFKIFDTAATLTAMGNMHLTGTISGTGNVNFQGQSVSLQIPTNPGEMWVDNPANTYTGNTRFSGNTHIAADASTGIGGAWGSAGGVLYFEGPVTNSRPINIEATQTFDTKANNVTLNGPITCFGSATSWGAPVTGVGLIKNGVGTLTLTNAVNQLGGKVWVNAGTLLIDGNVGPQNSTSSPFVVYPGATLGGSGTIYRNVMAYSIQGAPLNLPGPYGGGTVAPGNSPGILTIWGSLDLAAPITNPATPASTLSMQLNGPNPGTGYDQIQLQNAASGVVLRLGGAEGPPATTQQAVLQLSLGYAPTANSRFWLIVNTNQYLANLGTANTTTGTFAGLPEGATVQLGTIGGVTYTGTISYTGDFDTDNPAAGTGNDVVIYSVHGCGSADFNCDGDVGTDADIESFFSCLAGSCPSAPCGNSADFNGDGDVGTDSDIEAFFRVLAGGSC